MPRSWQHGMLFHLPEAASPAHPLSTLAAPAVTKPISCLNWGYL